MSVFINDTISEDLWRVNNPIICWRSIIVSFRYISFICSGGMFPDRCGEMIRAEKGQKQECTGIYLALQRLTPLLFYYQLSSLEVLQLTYILLFFFFLFLLRIFTFDNALRNIYTVP